MEMLVLILGWHFVILSLLAIVLGVMLGSISLVFPGTGVLLIGLAISCVLGRACVSDPPELNSNPERPLDYY